MRGKRAQSTPEWGVGFASKASKKKSIPTPHLVKYSVLGWRPVPRDPIRSFNDRIKYQKIEGCEQSRSGVCKAHAEIIETRSFKRYNKEQFRSEVADIPWSVVESFDDLNDAVSAWNTLFIDVANRHAPIKKLRIKRAIKPWITKELKELMAERDYAFKVAKRSGNEQGKWNNFRKLKNLTNRKIKAAEALYHKNLIESTQGPKEMWRTLNSALGNKKDENLTF